MAVSACSTVTPIGAIIIGLIAGALCAYAVGLKYRLGFDDSLDVVGVHLVAGLWGTIALGFLAWAPDGESPGLFYGGDYKQLVIQLVIAGVAVAYCGILTALIAFVLKPLGWRISDEEEATGIDETEHAETAYDYA